MLQSPDKITPKEFEQFVQETIKQQGILLEHFSTQHLEKIIGIGGEYEIDVTARFSTLGADFLVVIECKHWTSSVKREQVQVLHDKLKSVGGHKGMLFTTSDFQRGAIEYAKVHRIALVRVVDGKSTYEVRSSYRPREAPVWLPRLSGYLVQQSIENTISNSGLFDAKRDSDKSVLEQFIQKYWQ